MSASHLKVTLNWPRGDFNFFAPSLFSLQHFVDEIPNNFFSGRGSGPESLHLIIFAPEFIGTYVLGAFPICFPIRL